MKRRVHPKGDVPRHTPAVIMRLQRFEQFTKYRPQTPRGPQGRDHVRNQHPAPRILREPCGELYTATVAEHAIDRPTVPPNALRDAVGTDASMRFASNPQLFNDGQPGVPAECRSGLPRSFASPAEEECKSMPTLATSGDAMPFTISRNPKL